MNGTVPDQELMQLITVRDEDALKKLYDRYERPVYAFVYRMVINSMIAEEIVQELFLRIWNRTERFDGGQGQLTGWMFTLARNITVDFLRRQRNRTPQYAADSEQLNFVVDDKIDTDAEADKQWVGEQVKEALQALNKDQRQIVELIYFQGYTHQEISDRHTIPLIAVKTRVRLALKQLQQRLSGVGGRGEDYE
jgi:RNA polymerase sigma factor (sigma-70 family)